MVNISKALSSRKFAELLGNNAIDPVLSRGSTQYRTAMARHYSPTKKTDKDFVSANKRAVKDM